MPRTRILLPASAIAAAVPVLTTLTGYHGWVPDAAGAVALLLAALAAFLLVRRPVARWALTLGLTVAAAAWVVGRLPVTGTDLIGQLRQSTDHEYAAQVLLLIAVAGLTVGTAALPRSRRPWWMYAAAAVVALVPIGVVAGHLAGESDSAWPMTVDHAALTRLFGPGVLATVLAGVLVVLAVSRTDRWFLLVAGAVLIQATIADRTTGLLTPWYLSLLQTVADAEPLFPQPPPGAGALGPVPDRGGFDLGAALYEAALLAGPAFIVAGAARTALPVIRSDHPTAPPSGAVVTGG